MKKFLQSSNKSLLIMFNNTDWEGSYLEYQDVLQLFFLNFTGCPNGHPYYIGNVSIYVVFLPIVDDIIFWFMLNNISIYTRVVPEVRGS